MSTYEADYQRTIGYIVQDKAEQYGERTFLRFADESHSYAELNRRSNQVANALSSLGLKKGDKVVTILPSIPEYFYAWWGIVKLGALEVPLSYNYRGASLTALINRSEAKAIVVFHEFLEKRLAAIKDQLKNVTHIIVAHRLEAGRPDYDPQAFEQDLIPLADLMAESDHYPPAQVFNYDPSCIVYTSGTTGPPKAVVHAHEFWLHGSEMKIKHMGTTADDVIYNCFPMYNPTGQVETSLCALMAGAGLALAPGFNPAGFWDDIRKYGCTETVSMGGMFALVEKNPPHPDDRNHPLKKVYIIPLPEAFQKRCEERFGVKMMEIYGQTEAGLVCFRSWDNPVPGSCGRANSGYDIKIFDQNDNECPPGQPGEIVIRPHKNHTIIKGYYDMPERFAARMSNCWWHTGDLGHLDEAGNLFFHRRMEESVRFRGQFVPTTEVEKILNNHPDIVDSAVYGVPDELNQEQDVMVAIRLRPGSDLAPEEILAHCEQDLPYHMIPCYVRFVDEFDRTPTMRIIKEPLQKEGVTSDTWNRRRAGYKLSRK